MQERIIDLAFERISDAMGDLHTFPKDLCHTQRLLFKGGAPKEDIEVEKRFDVAFQQGGKVGFVKAVQLMRRLFMIEPPEPAVRKQAPFDAAMLDIERDLKRGVFVGKGVAALLAQGRIERAVPVLRVSNGEPALTRQRIV